MDCKAAKNKTHCPCTYDPCSRKGICCDCVDYHRRQGELPGCFFPPEYERTYNRSLQAFLEANRQSRGR